MKPFRLSRRAVLRGIGAGIALPLLDAMVDDRGLLHGTAGAAPTPPPVRLLTFFFPCGWGNLDPLGNFRSVLAGPLAPFKTSVLAIENLDKSPQYGDDSSGRADAHATGCCTFATGYGTIKGGAGGPSVDQFAAQALGGATRFRSLPVGIGNAYEPYFDGVSWQGAASPVQAEHDPVKLFQKLFGSGTPAPTPTAAPPPDYRKNVLDYVRGDLNRLTRRVGQADRARLDQHATAIAELQQSIAALPPPVTATCQAPASPAANLGTLTNERAQIMMKLLVLALACDLTRYGSFFLCGRPDEREYPWLGITGGGGPDNEVGHHGYSHDDSSAGEARMKQIVLDQAAQFAFLLQAMQAVPEASGTLLDNSLVFFGTEHFRSFAHQTDQMPVVIAGKAGGKLTSGRTIDAGGAPYARTFVSLLGYAGAPTTGFGPYATGPLAGL